MNNLQKNEVQAVVNILFSIKNIFVPKKVAKKYSKSISLFLNFEGSSPETKKMLLFIKKKLFISYSFIKF
jgi:hypothetical protein